MLDEFYLAWRYLCFNLGRTLILVSCLGLTAALPFVLHEILDAGETWMTERAAATPLLIGARGSSVDLTLSTLHFTTQRVPTIALGEARAVSDTGWGEPIPVYVRSPVQGFPLVGITLDYFDFRELRTAEGDLPALLGDCVLGAEVAERLNLHPGDRLVSAATHVFDLAGAYPLNMRVSGVLARARSADDQAIFVDLKTAWVIDGLGHGHSAVESPATQAGTAPFADLNVRVTTAQMPLYTEITDANRASFHFHGDMDEYPISAILVRPRDARAMALLRGRYVDESRRAEAVKPLNVTRTLLQSIFRISALLDGVLLLVSGVALGLLGLVFALSLRLRKKEIHTIFLLGCSRMTVVRLLVAELTLIGLASGTFCLGIHFAVRPWATDLARHFLLN